MSDWLPHAVRAAEAWLDHQLRATEQPGCVLAIARGGELVAERAFGLADLASGETLTPAHRFRVASHSKTFTAAAVMKLREAGRLRLDDPVGDHVAGLAGEVAAATLGQLLSHSAGLVRDGAGAPHWQGRAPFFAEGPLRAELAADPVLTPNSRFKYSNVGFGLLGLAVEAIAGESYASFVAREVAAASGLAATAPDMPVPPGVPLAVGHTARLPAGRRLAVPGHEDTGALAAATGFVSTAGDLARFFDSLDPGAVSSCLSTASRREMTRRHWAVPDDALERHYGLGIIGGTTAEGHGWFGHSGAFPGFISRTACVPAWGVTVSVVTNAIDGLAHPWVDGVLAFLHRFAAEGAPEGPSMGWTGRWWTQWAAVDLVPAGAKVFAVDPARPQPFADAGEIAPDTATEGRIARANGFGSHGEPARLVPAGGEWPARLLLGGTEFVSENTLVAELEARAGAAPAAPGAAAASARSGTWPTETGRFALGDLRLESGAVLRGAALSWKSYGTLSPARDNVVVYPTSYSAQHGDQEWLIGPDGVLDPERWFIVTPDMFGNGLSSSPSNTPDYPALVTAADNVRAQRRLLLERFGIDRVAAVYGFSMGAQQSYHWAALFPEAVERAIVVCGSARTSVHNKVFLLSLLATLEAAPEHLGGGRFSSEPRAHLRAFARIYAGWAMSQDWYRAGLHLSALGAVDLDDFLDRLWEPGFTRRAAADLHAQATTWLHADISAGEPHGGDLAEALGAIRARVLLVPSRTDLYFPVADNAAELPHLAHGMLRPIETIWGHRAGSPGDSPEDFAALRQAVRGWLDAPPASHDPEEQP